MTRLIKSIVGLSLCLLSFAYLILVLNPIQLLSIVLYPISKGAFRSVNRWCARSIWGLWVLMAEFQAGISLRFVGDVVPRRENAILIVNHQTMADVMVLLCFSWRCGRLGDLKWFVKDIVKWIPGVGWGMKFLDCVFVKRNWARDRGGIGALFGKYRQEAIPIFLVSFLEGTRLTPAKLRRSQEFAREAGHRVPSHSLLPRTKGFVAMTHGLRDHIDAVYDLTIGYPGGAPTLLSCFAGRVSHIEVDVRRYEVSSLPPDDEGLSRWVFERYAAKDELLAGFAERARFPGEDRTGGIRALDWFVPEARRRSTHPSS